MNEDKAKPLSQSHGDAKIDTIEDATSFELEDKDGIQSGDSEPIDVDEQDDEDTSGKLKSVVWQHFERKKICNDTKAICNYCKKMLGANSKNGTSHLKNHLSRCSKRKYVDLKQKILTNNMMKDKKAQLSAYSFDQEFTRKQLAHMIILHEYPLSIVEHVGFQRFISALQPLFKVVCRNTIKSDIMKIFDNEKSRTMKLLGANMSRVAITTDMWTSNNQRRGFMAITAHFIDDLWKLQSRIIRFAYVPCPHTKEVLCDVLMDCLLDWNLDRKLSTITVDNCTTNDGMVGILIDKLGKRSLLLGGSLFHMRCAAHILNLIVKDGLSTIQEGIEKVRNNVAYWTASPKREEKFFETVGQLSILETKKLALDCPTRWNSTFLMLDTAIKYKNVFFRLKQRDSQYLCLPSEGDWDFAMTVCSHFKLFYKATEIFSGTQYPTMNMYFLKIIEIKMELSKWAFSRDDLVRNMSSMMLLKFEKYWSVVHGIAGAALVLDPRYKMSFIEYYYPKLFALEAVDEIEKIKKICYDLLEEYQHRSAIEVNSIHNSSHLTTMGNFDYHEDKFSDFDDYVMSKNKRNKLAGAKSELDHYLEEDCLPRHPDFDILGWWKSNGLKYPTLQKIARDVLAVPVSTVASESAFSTSGRWVSPHRSRLNPDTVEALMCTQNWLAADEVENGGMIKVNPIGYASICEDFDERSCMSYIDELTEDVAGKALSSRK